MEYKVYKKVLRRKENNAIIEEEPNQNLKRKDKDILKAKKCVKKNDHPWFHIKYKKTSYSFETCRYFLKRRMLFK